MASSATTADESQPPSFVGESQPPIAGESLPPIAGESLPPIAAGESQSLSTPEVQWMIHRTWACISAPINKNRLYDHVFPDQGTLAAAFAASLVTVGCPNFLSTVQEDEPPTTEFFYNLPSDGEGRWGVYALVLEKPGAISKVYVGSGTESRRGVISRWRTYDRFDVSTMPRYVFSAVHKEGYKIAYKGLLAFAPIPTAADIPRFRLLFVAIEATFSFLFWAMKSETKDYGIGAHCPWPQSSFSYRGLCGNNAMIEGVNGNFDLTAEQLEALAAEDRRRRNAFSVTYRQAAMVDDPDRRLGLEREYGARYRLKHADEVDARLKTYVAENLDTVRKTKTRSAAKVKESKKYSCTMCGVSCSTPWELKRHNDSRRHKRNVKKAALGVTKPYRCDICGYATEVLGSLTRHLAGKLHLKRAAKAAGERLRPWQTSNKQEVQFPVFQGERVNCEDNTSLGEFTLAPIPPMRAGEAVLECVFEVDVNGILKVTATEKTSGRSANITIANSVGKLSTGEIEKMISDAEAFKSNDDAFQKKFEAKQQLESYISRVEEIVSDPTLSLKLKRGQKDKIESTISDAMAALELGESSADDLKKQELALKRLVTKAMSSR
ncbi:hypothetical protein FDECE_16023 [Fusarium decemcellulare]|nr:hypothetical protein FDECE_16023 [Fusarium decemcellulare]